MARARTAAAALAAAFPLLLAGAPGAGEEAEDGLWVELEGESVRLQTVGEECAAEAKRLRPHYDVLQRVAPSLEAGRWDARDDSLRLDLQHLWEDAMAELCTHWEGVRRHCQAFDQVIQTPEPCNWHLSTSTPFVAPPSSNEEAPVPAEDFLRGAVRAVDRHLDELGRKTHAQMALNLDPTDVIGPMLDVLIEGLKESQMRSSRDFRDELQRLRGRLEAGAPDG